MDFENQMFVELLSEDGLIILARQGWETHTCTQLHYLNYGSTLKSMVGPIGRASSMPCIQRSSDFDSSSSKPGHRGNTCVEYGLARETTLE